MRARRSESISLRAALKSANDLTDEYLPEAVAGYCHSRIRNEAHDHVLSVFEELQVTKGISKAFLARRLGKDPAQITRLLGAPGNWTLETLAELLVAMGRLPVIRSEAVIPAHRVNYCPPEHEAAIHAGLSAVNIFVNPGTADSRPATSNAGTVVKKFDMPTQLHD